MPPFQKARRGVISYAAANALIKPCDVKSYRDAHPGLCEKYFPAPTSATQSVNTGELVAPKTKLYTKCPFCGQTITG